MRVCLSVDFDALSGYLGTGHTPENTMADYSAGLLSANNGVPRLLRIFSKYGIADKITWFIPGHSIETFPKETQDVVDSGAEIALHGYSHEGANAMTVEQERDVIEKCIGLAAGLKGGQRPRGYRAPLYQIRESTVALLQEHGFLYDSSMNAQDALPYYLPSLVPQTPLHVPDYSKPASTWMKPTPLPIQPLAGTAEAEKALVEVPTSWYTEDMTPMGFYPYAPNSQGYVSTDVMEKIWWDRFEWLWENESFLDEEPGKGFGTIYPIIWHPESAGRAHIVGMVDRFIGRLVEVAKKRGGEITFDSMADVAEDWKRRIA